MLPVKRQEADLKIKTKPILWRETASRHEADLVTFVCLSFCRPLMIYRPAQQAREGKRHKRASLWQYCGHISNVEI